MNCACDASMKGGYHLMVNTISWCKFNENVLHVVALDSDAYYGTDYDTSHELDCGFQKLDPTNVPNFFLMVKALMQVEVRLAIV